MLKVLILLVSFLALVQAFDMMGNDGFFGDTFNQGFGQFRTAKRSRDSNLARILRGLMKDQERQILMQG